MVWRYVIILIKKTQCSESGDSDYRNIHFQFGIVYLADVEIIAENFNEQ